MSNPALFTVDSSDNVAVAAYDLGGNGPALLFCHATGFCGMVWQPLAQALSQSFHCFALDFRAHGRSTVPTDGNMNWTGMADDIVAVVDAIAPDGSVRAVGHSLGGGSMVLAESKRPGILTSGWAFEPILFPLPPAGEAPDAPHPSHMSEQARRRRNKFSSRDEVYERYRRRPPLSLLDDRCLRAYVEHGFRDREDGTVELSCAPEHEARTFEQHRTGADQLVGDLSIPFALAIGVESEPPALATVDVSGRFPHLELIRYPDLNHFGPLQDPERLASDIADWFSRNDNDND